MKNCLKLGLIACSVVLMNCGPRFETADTTSDAGPKDASLDLNLNAPSPGPISYRGGPVMIDDINVYLIWYGDWSASKSPVIIPELIDSYSDSSYARSCDAYYQERITTQSLPEKPVSLSSVTTWNIREHVHGKIKHKKSVFVGYRHGEKILDNNVKGLVEEELQTGALPYDPNGAYFVLTSSDVSVTDAKNYVGFCTHYCGWHTSDSINGQNVRYSFVGDPGKCLDGCTVQQTFSEFGIKNSPNGDWGTDGMASIFVHELIEIITDPDPRAAPAWTDIFGYENADMCAWRFEPTYQTTNGSRANVKIGQRDYLIQQTWVIDEQGNGHCGLKP